LQKIACYEWILPCIFATIDQGTRQQTEINSKNKCSFPGNDYTFEATGQV